ncbi:DUF1330 domain-containing protein [Lacihabitans sp. LS3-19]|uniref:DUF1330 domain-containing protein n=1 Tax=Lacihabitans sp. LS3-19 TaxID=2487335 RepID=UPI0020CBF8BC|nr:DUF1330 domain-containing protein [Lacihabitans sp. LS3-19]MCP9768979.1 DUF1330 domain-containing protein [Lacihabitans sp. LS3-19]
MKTFLIVNAIPNTEDKESFQSYLSQIVGIFAKFGGSGMQRWKTVDQVMGKGGIKAIAVFEFPSAQNIKDMIASEEFNALNDLRKKAYKQEVDLMICEAL